MPIIRIRNASGMLSPKKIANNFKIETDIALHIFLDREEITGSELPMEKIWLRHPVLKSFIPLLNDSDGADFIVILAKTSLLMVKKIFTKQLGTAVSFFQNKTELDDITLLLQYKNYSTHSSLLQNLYAVNQEFIEITEVLKQQSERSVELFQEYKRCYQNRKEMDFESEFKIHFFLDESDPLCDVNDENLVFSYSSINSGILYPKDMGACIAFWEKELKTLPRKYWKELSLANNHPVLNPCYLFYHITNYLIDPFDLVRMKKYWIEFYHVNQILDGINYEKQK